MSASSVMTPLRVTVVRKRNKRRHSIDDHGSQGLSQAGNQIPERECVARPGFPKHDIQLPGAFAFVLPEIHIIQGSLQHFGGVIEIRRADSAAGPRSAKSSGRDNGFASMKIECDQAECDMKQRAAITLHFAGIDAPEIDRRRRRCVDNKQTRWRPCSGGHSSALERDAVLIGIGGDQSNPGIRIEIQLSDVCDVNFRFRMGIGLQRVSRPKTAGARQLHTSDPRRPPNTGDFP